MNQQEREAIIRFCLVECLDPDKRYPTPLPEEVAGWYCFTVDGGHSILVAIKDLFRGADPTETQRFLVPVPVKTALRSYTITPEGYVLCDLPHFSSFGAIIPFGDREF